MARNTPKANLPTIIVVIGLIAAAWFYTHRSSAPAPSGAGVFSIQIAPTPTGADGPTAAPATAARATPRATARATAKPTARPTKPTTQPRRSATPARATAAPSNGSSGWSAADRRLLQQARLDPDALLQGAAGDTIQRLKLSAADVIYVLRRGGVDLGTLQAVARTDGQVVAFLADYRGGGRQELGWSHIVHRHIEWSDRGQSGGSTSMYPTGAAGTPSKMTRQDVQAVIIAGIEAELPNTELRANDRTELVYRLPSADQQRWGVARVQIVLEPWGAVVTAYPLSGPAVIQKRN